MKRLSSGHIYVLTRVVPGLIFVLAAIGLPSAKNAYAYSTVTDRPVFLDWPLPYYIGLARISQYPNTPWTWNHLGLNSGQQCPPAFGYLLDSSFWSVWRDASVPEKQDMAKADPHNFEMVNCYSTLGEAGKNGHEGTDIKAPAGTPAYASADGKVAGWRIDNINSMIVLKHCLHGQWDAAGTCVGGTKWYTTYMHITPEQSLLQMEKDLLAGTQVGVIINQGDNSHLHFEVGLDKRSYMNYINPWGRDESPWFGCMWKDQSLCVYPNPGYKRTGIFTQANRLLIRDDRSNLVEIFAADQIQQFQMSGHRMALIDQNGNLWANEVEFKVTSPFGHEFVRNWALVGNNFVSYQVTNSRIAILEPDGTFKIQEGDLKNDWTLQVQNTRSFSISEHRVGVLTVDGKLMIKENALDSEWLLIASNVKAFQVLDSRIAVLDLLGNLFVQEGVSTNEWKHMAAKVRAFQLSGTRVAVVDEMGNLMVNDGNLRAEWVQQADHIRQFQLADNRIVILDKDGRWMIKEGDLYQPWKEIAGVTLKEIQLNGETPVQLEE